MTISFLTDLSVSLDDRLRNTKTEKIKKIEGTLLTRERERGMHFLVRSTMFLLPFMNNAAGALGGCIIDKMVHTRECVWRLYFRKKSLS